MSKAYKIKVFALHTTKELVAVTQSQVITWNEIQHQLTICLKTVFGFPFDEMY